MTLEVSASKKLEHILFSNFFKNGEYIIQISSNDYDKYKESKEISHSVLEFQIYKQLRKANNLDNNFIILSEDYLKSPNNLYFFKNFDVYSHKIILIPRTIENKWMLTIIENFDSINNNFRGRTTNNNQVSIKLILCQDHKKYLNTIINDNIKFFLNSLRSVFTLLENNRIINNAYKSYINKIGDIINKRIYTNYIKEIIYYKNDNNSGIFILNFFQELINSKSASQFLRSYFYKNNLRISMDSLYSTNVNKINTMEKEKEEIKEFNQNVKEKTKENLGQKLFISSYTLMTPKSSNRNLNIRHSLPQRDKKIGYSNQTHKYTGIFNNNFKFNNEENPFKDIESIRKSIDTYKKCKNSSSKMVTSFKDLDTNEDDYMNFIVKNRNATTNTNRDIHTVNFNKDLCKSCLFKSDKKLTIPKMKDFNLFDKDENYCDNNEYSNTKRTDHQSKQLTESKKLSPSEDLDENSTYSNGIKIFNSPENERKKLNVKFIFNSYKKENSECINNLNELNKDKERLNQLNQFIYKINIDKLNNCNHIRKNLSTSLPCFGKKINISNRYDEN